MPKQLPTCCILNSGPGSWAFEPLALELSSAIGVPVSDQPGAFNYLLQHDSLDFPHPLFIPLDCIRLASDKRLIAAAFAKARVPTPRTELLPSFAEVLSLVSLHPDKRWCLKYPTSCGANGHRMITLESSIPAKWPTPFVLQEFIEQPNPEVYRIYCAGRELFGWMVRRFPPGAKTSPWVAHARGARYARLSGPPDDAAEVAHTALSATGLLESFGCVDLLCNERGEWLALEVGTDGLFNHVDRELDCPEMEAEILRRIADAFWRRAESLGF